MSRQHRGTEDHVERALVAALEREAERTPVAAAPVSAIRHAAGRRGRGEGRRPARPLHERPWPAALAVAASIALLIGGVASFVDTDAPEPVTDAAVGGERGEGGLPAHPPGTTWRGAGSVGLPVPDSWRVSAGELCPESQAPAVDTFNVDPPGRPVRLDSCFTAYTRRSGVESVIANSSVDAEVPTKGAREFDLDGRSAFRTPVVCEELRGEGRRGVVELCSGLILVPEESASITVTSTTDRQTVERLLDQVRVVDDAAAVPWLTFDTGRTVAVRTGEYQARVRELGLEPRVRKVTADIRRGTVLGLIPDIGTMLPRGSDVEIEVSRGPRAKSSDATSGPDREISTSPARRLLGLGAVAVPVPRDWATGQSPSCRAADVATAWSRGGPGAFDARACQSAQDTESVIVMPSDGLAGPPGRITDADVNGETASRRAVTCAGGEGSICGGEIFFPDLGISVIAGSRTDAATAERLLDGVRVLRRHVGLPSPDDLDVDAYADLLRSYGLEPRLVGRTARKGLAAGRVLSTDVAPGTIVPRGDVIRIRYARGSSE